MVAKTSASAHDEGREPSAFLRSGAFSLFFLGKTLPEGSFRVLLGKRRIKRRFFRESARKFENHAVDDRFKLFERFSALNTPSGVFPQLLLLGLSQTPRSRQGAKFKILLMPSRTRLHLMLSTSHSLYHRDVWTRTGTISAKDLLDACSICGVGPKLPGDSVYEQYPTTVRTSASTSSKCVHNSGHLFVLHPCHRRPIRPLHVFAVLQALGNSDYGRSHKLGLIAPQFLLACNPRRNKGEASPAVPQINLGVLFRV